MTSPAALEPVALTGRDWGMLVAVALMWGSSYLFIKIGLEDFPPATIAWLRIALGALALTLVPAARAPLRHREDWRLTAILGVVWMAVPFVLFTVAQQHIASALAGMINGAAPLFTAAVAAVWWRRSPDRPALPPPSPASRPSHRPRRGARRRRGRRCGP